MNVIHIVLPILVSVNTSAANTLVKGCSSERYAHLSRLCGSDTDDERALIQSLLEIGVDNAVRLSNNAGWSSQQLATQAPTDPSTTTTTIPPGRRRYYANNIPACEDDYPPDTLDDVRPRIPTREFCSPRTA
jgi:hypothetical protein